MYMCIISQIGLSVYFSHFYLSPLLMVILKGLNILYSFLYRKYINHILDFLLLPSHSHKWPPLSVTCCLFLSFIHSLVWQRIAITLVISENLPCCLRISWENGIIRPRLFSRLLKHPGRLIFNYIARTSGEAS
jgi:hypothetical protein